MQNNRIYIMGKVSDLPRKIYMKKFRQSADRLRELGYEPVNPVEHVHPDSTWHEAMRHCIRLLCTCDAVLAQEDWVMSRGARIEYNLAMELDMPIIEERFLGRPQ